MSKIEERDPSENPDDDYVIPSDAIIASLRQQLAAALAACKQKDGALEKIIATIPGQADGGGLVVDHYTNEGEFAGSENIDPMLVVQEIHSLTLDALAIQPDDSALLAWLGESVAVVVDNDAGNFGRLEDQLPAGIPLYAPKGMK